MAKSQQEERIKQNDERENYILTLLGVIKKFYPSLFNDFNGTDPRNKSYITYTMRYLLTILFFKYALSIVSMRSMTNAFERSAVIANLTLFGGMKGCLLLPSAHAINNFLMILPLSFLWTLRKTIITTLIRSKRLDKGRFKKMFAVIIDATQTYGGSIPINLKCTKRVHGRGKENEHTTFHRNVLEAKLWLVGTPFVFSICTEFIENDPGATENDKRSKEKIKQDCELAAFNRLVVKLHADYPKLPIVLLADSLYISNNVFNICNKYGWKFMIRYKTGSAPSIQEYVDTAIQGNDLITIPDQKEYKGIGYYLGVPYYNNVLNYVQATVIDDDPKKTQNLKWVTNIPITYRVEYILDVITLGRGRWKIENQGFNRQKKWLGVLEHLCCWHDQALKNHYLMIQIADIFLTLLDMTENLQEEKKEYRNPEYKRIIRTFQQRKDDLRDGLKHIQMDQCGSWKWIKALVEEPVAA